MARETTDSRPPLQLGVRGAPTAADPRSLLEMDAKTAASAGVTAWSARSFVEVDAAAAVGVSTWLEGPAPTSLLKCSVANMMATLSGFDFFSNSDVFIQALGLGNMELTISAIATKMSPPGFVLVGSLVLETNQVSFSVIVVATKDEFGKNSYGFGVDFNLEGPTAFSWIWSKLTGSTVGSEAFLVTKADIAFANSALAESKSPLLAAFPMYANSPDNTVPVGLFVSFVGYFNPEV